MLARHILLFTIATLSACAETTTAPSGSDAAPSTALVGTTAAPESEFTCAVRSEISGYTLTASWNRALVQTVTVLLDEAPSITRVLDHPRRKGSIAVESSDRPLGIILENRKEVVASGGCEPL